MRTLIVRGWHEAGAGLRLSMQCVTPDGRGERRFAEVAGTDAGEAELAAFGREVLELLFAD